MSTRDRFLLAAVIAAAILVFAVAIAYKSAQAQAVLTVVNQNSQAARACQEIRMVGRLSQTNFNALQFVARLRKIDSSRCPKQFQFAWLEYVQAWERAAVQTRNRLLVEAALFGAGIWTKSPALGNIGAKPIEAVDALQQAWQRVERVALEYNVRVLYR